MAFASSVIWRSYPRAGSSLNGGGFDPVSGVPGVDYSQQATAQFTYTDLVIDGSNSAKVTGAAHPLTAATVGNIINITGGTGFTVQRVQVLGVTGSTATVDKSLGTLGSTGGAGKLGGAIDNIANIALLMVSGNTYTEAELSGSTKLSRARQIIRLAARNAGDATYYETFMVDMALQRAANKLIRDGMLALRLDGIATTANQAEYATPTGFRADRLDSVYLTGPNVVVYADWDGIDPRGLYTRGAIQDVDYGNNGSATSRLTITTYDAVNDLAIANPLVGQPRLIGFSNDGGYALYPTPDQAYVVNIRWSDLFSTWGLGTPLTSFTNTAGVLSAVVVVDSSDNQGAALTASFSDSGGGSGATATATVTNGALASVAVGGAGGTGYSSLTKLLLAGNDTADVTLNLPDDYLNEVLTLGAPSFLCFADPEKAFAANQAKAWEEYVTQVKGRIGGLGAQRIVRRRV